MKISHIKISNILGIDHLEFTPGGFNEIVGPNGTGKTSILEAIKSATGSGHDATLLRQGAEKGEVVLVLDDGTEIQERLTPARTVRDVTRDGKKVTKPSDAIKALTDMLSVNPVEFLTAPKKDRVRVLLETMPIHLDVERLSKISGIDVVAAEGSNALSVINHIRQQVYDDRTGTNRAVTEKESTINQLRVALPDAPGGIEGDEDELRAKHQQALEAMHAEHARIDGKLGGMKADSAAKVQAMRDEARAKVDAINAELQVAIDAERAALAENEAKAARVRQKASDTCTATIQPLTVAIQAIVDNRDAAAKRKATLETIAQMEEDKTSLAEDAARQTKALADIDAYKVELLASLPIPGLEVRDGDLFRDGVQFDRLNTAQQVDIAVEVARLRAGDLSIVCVDRLECLDPPTLEAFREKTRAAGLQLFVTRVNGEEFAVKTE